MQDYVANYDYSYKYSTSEKRAGTWIDGKPIYKMTINFGTLPNNNTKTVNHNIANIDNIVGIEGLAVGANNSLPLPFIFLNNYAYSIQMYVSKTYVSIQTGNDRTGHTGYVTISYTKTTDTV